MNQMILQGLRTRLDEAKGMWVEELPNILWVYHTIPRTSSNEIPFNLVFGAKVVIPIKIGLPTIWIEHYDESSNPVQLLFNLDLLKEIRDKALLHMASY